MSEWYMYGAQLQNSKTCHMRIEGFNIQFWCLTLEASSNSVMFAKFDLYCRDTFMWASVHVHTYPMG